jgi:threonine aldolase
MRRVMARAEVGDDVMGEDPTVRTLERRIAAILGHEAALFVPSGTMANQIAVGVHAGPGDELVCTSTSHVYVWEGGGIARLWGVTTRTLEGDRGLAGAGHLAGLIRPDDAHYPRTRLVCLENTHNRGGGRVHAVEEVAAVGAWARSHGLAFHLDGARLFNAAIAAGRPASDWATLFDSVAVCFSKGLGAPVGSAIVGSEALIRKAHRLRKVLGGGMRQSGILAAAALHALDHHVERLAEDHANAQILADAIRRAEGLRLEFDPVETNLVWFTIDPGRGTAAEFAARLKERGVLVSALGPQNLRACTHLDLSREQAEHAAEVIAAAAGS